MAKAAQPNWTPVGPDGGDARALTAVPGEPSHLYLGTTTSLIYESTDEGASWHRLARLDAASDLVVDHILVDPANTRLLYAAAWKFDHPEGGLWISRDAGKSWQEAPGLHGQSIRAFAQAPSNPQILFAGTLQGVFRSADGGGTWKLISPPGSTEIHEVESLAIDPGNPDVIYAGTWHLPWKTSDGGAHWANIKQGVIDDSDVFSIIINPERSNVVYMSACSGIYKSENGGALFKKIQGIPATARRTRVLQMDPAHHDTVYAGTTEGLYKTTDAGRTFRRMTGPDVIVNDIFVDPTRPERVLLATDRGGVQISKDASVSFELSNRGFSARKVEALLVDAKDPARIYAGVVNDKSYGGVFVSKNRGASWQQTAEGLEGRDVFALAQSPEGVILAGTNSGIFALAEDASAWKSRNTLENIVAKPVNQLVHGKRVTVEKKVKEGVREITGRVSALDLSGNVWAVATSGGLYTSKDRGESWQGGPSMGVDYVSIAVHGADMAAARPEGVVLSRDNGETWWPMGLPTAVSRIHRIVFSADGTLWLGSREGVYFTQDKGKTWMWVHRLPLVDVSDLYYDAQQNTVLVSSRGSDFIYEIDAKTLDWKWHQTGYPLLLVRAAGDRLLAASLDDGVLVEPKETQSAAGPR
ncbi:transcriptional regulator [Acidobacteria bacterium AB60]|nr:transcriptional regulator [Acidobacteria bacterium AB60]